MINYAPLALGPAIATLGQPVVINPLASQPGVAPYGAIGIWTNKPVEIATEQGGYISTNMPVLGIMLSMYAVPPLQDDQLTINGLTYDIVDVVQDGVCGAELWLRQV